MSGFRFRLEVVRRLRKRAEEERAGDLADAMSEAGDAAAQREELEAIERAGRAQLKHLEGGVAHLQSVQVMLEHLEEHHDEAREKCREATERVRDRQDAYVKAVTDRQALDRLKDRREKTWKQDESRREQKSQDEVSATMHGREESRGASDTGEGDR